MFDVAYPFDYLNPIHFLPVKQLYFNKLANADQPLCGFWDTNISDWSTVGCRLQENTLNGLFQCTCIHTTFFALIGVSI